MFDIILLMSVLLTIQARRAPHQCVTSTGGKCGIVKGEHFPIKFCLRIETCANRIQLVGLDTNATGTTVAVDCDEGPVDEFKTCEEYLALSIFQDRNGIAEDSGDKNNTELIDRISGGDAEDIQCRNRINPRTCTKYDHGESGQWCLLNTVCRNNTDDTVDVSNFTESFCVFRREERLQSECAETRFEDEFITGKTTFEEYFSLATSATDTQRVKPELKTDCSSYVVSLSCNCGEDDFGEFCFLTQNCGLERETIAGVCYKEGDAFTNCTTAKESLPSREKFDRGQFEPDDGCVVSLDYSTCDKNKSECFYTQLCRKSKNVEFIASLSQIVDNEDYSYMCTRCSDSSSCQRRFESNKEDSSESDEKESCLMARPLCNKANQSKCPSTAQNLTRIFNKCTGQLDRVCNTDTSKCTAADEFVQVALRRVTVNIPETGESFTAVEDVDGSFDITETCSCDFVNQNRKCISRDFECRSLSEEYENCSYTSEFIAENVFEVKKFCSQVLNSSRVLMMDKICKTGFAREEERVIERFVGAATERCVPALFCAELNATSSQYEITPCEGKVRRAVNEKVEWAKKENIKGDDARDMRLSVLGPGFFIEVPRKNASDDDILDEADVEERAHFEFTVLREIVSDGQGGVTVLKEVDIESAEVKWSLPEIRQVSNGETNVSATRIAFSLYVLDGEDEFEVEAEILTFPGAFAVEYGDSLVEGLEDSVKFTLTVLDWPFKSKDSILMLEAQLNSTSKSSQGEKRCEQTVEKLRKSSGDSSEERNNSIVSGGNVRLQAPQFMLADDIIQPVEVEISCSENEDRSTAITVKIQMGYFEDIAIYDPVMSVGFVQTSSDPVDDPDESSSVIFSLSFIVLIGSSLLVTVML